MSMCVIPLDWSGENKKKSHKFAEILHKHTRTDMFDF